MSFYYHCKSSSSSAAAAVDNDDVSDPMLFDSTSRASLSIPLIGHEAQGEEQEGEPIHDMEFDCDSSSSNCGTSRSWCDFFLVWLILPGFLWLDFCLAYWTTYPSIPFYSHNDNMSPCPHAALALLQQQQLRLSSVNAAFVLLIVSSFLYRKTTEGWETKTPVVVLVLPEIGMNLVLILIVFHKLVAAFMVLLGTILLLSLIVVVNSLAILFCSSPEDEEEEEEADELLDAECAVAKVYS